MKSSTDPVWISDEVWGCRKHVPCARFPSVQKKCWYCGTERPVLREGQKILPFRTPEVARELAAKRAALSARRAERYAETHRTPTPVDGVPVRVPDSTDIRCAWDGCLRMSVGRSKYCSRECSNKNARARHKGRKHDSQPPASSLTGGFPGASEVAE